MTLVLRSATLTDVSDRAARIVGGVRYSPSGSASDGFSNNGVNDWLDTAGSDRIPTSAPMLFNGSTWDRVRADVGGMLYQKPLPVTVRRSPRRILVADDFEATTLAWGTGTGTVTRDATLASVRAGIASMKLVTGATAGNGATALFEVGYQGLQKYVIELWWAELAAAVTTPRRFSVLLEVIDGTNNHYLEVAYLKNLTTAQNKWQFSADGTTYNDVTGGAETLTFRTTVPYTWHYFRGHFNMSAATPNLDELHTDTLDLTGLTAAGGVISNTATAVDLTVGGTTDVAAASTFAVDQVLVSDQEA